MIKIFENIYGHKSRIPFFKRYITKNQKGLELGCGTGIMVTSQLLQEGYDIIGSDLDEESINYGKEVFKKYGLNSEVLSPRKLEVFENSSFDYIIASEVFEHIAKENLPELITLIRSKLKMGGVLLITVPNGYGWYELESFFWKRMKVGKILNILRVPQIIYKLKKNILNLKFDSEFLSTLDESPHVRRFTIRKLKKLYTFYSFIEVKVEPSVLISGQFSNILFSGITWFYPINKLLGKVFPFFASGFYCVGKLKNENN
jgi:2-polyprenyl-3-methyl-5-hydroxy-6-metoxy-1,4-benzoquinol methylase